MSFGRYRLKNDPPSYNKNERWPWYWVPVFCATWFLLFYIVVISSYYRYPKMLRIRDERQHPEEFIGERSRNQLYELARIGVKTTGTVENEVYAVNYLLKEIAKIRKTARLDLYDLDVRVQHSSGQFKLWTMAISYRNITNIVVKISPKQSFSRSYLLLNSHFDSAVGSPAAADAGVMIVTMLETLRVLSRSSQELKNPVIFLLNGAEENGLLGSHAFITQHEWAPYCKALINLDSAGSGGREIVFQSGPHNPWLLKYYQQSVPHPFVSTIAEELFQHNFIPSDTDFRVFRDYGGVPGLDIAHTLNGYVYHTKFDTFGNLERGTYQTTGENVLALTRALANAEELGTIGATTRGNAVFNDFLGCFTVAYSEATGVTINIITSVSALLATSVSIYRMTSKKVAQRSRSVYLRFCAILLVQILTVVAAAGASLLMAVIVEASGLSLCWYSAEWIIFGLYYCPIFCVMGIIPALYIQWTEKNPMRLNDTIRCFTHAHCIILVFVCLLLTSLNIRSAYFVMIAVFFYTISVFLNLLTDCLSNKCYFIPIHLVCQLTPYWFYTYQAFNALKIFVPMQGRNGPTSKPELTIAGFSILLSLLFAGFIIPILHKFRKSKTIFSLFAVVSVIFFAIAASPVGFPFKPDVAVQRFYVLHTDRLIRDQSGDVRTHESGFYIQPVDPRYNTLDDSIFKNAVSQAWIDRACAEEVFCGLPLYSSRWMEWKNSTRWIPANPPHQEKPTRLKLISRENITETSIRLSFSLDSTDRVVIYVDPLAGVKVNDWSFDRTLIDQPYQSPYFIYHVDALVTEPFEFWIIVERDSQLLEGPSMRLGVGAHFSHHSYMYTQEFSEFLKSFPAWAYPTTGVAYFESWYF